MCFPGTSNAVSKDSNIEAVKEMLDRWGNCWGSEGRRFNVRNRTRTFVIKNDLLSRSLIVDAAELEGVHLMLVLEAWDADQIGLGGGLVIAAGRRYDAVSFKLRSLLGADTRNDSDSTHCSETSSCRISDHAVVIQDSYLQYS